MDLKKEIEYLESIKNKPGNNRKQVQGVINMAKKIKRIRLLYGDKKPLFMPRKKHELLRNDIKLKWSDQEAIEALEKAITHIKKLDILFTREGD